MFLYYVGEIPRLFTICVLIWNKVERYENIKKANNVYKLLL